MMNDSKILKKSAELGGMCKRKNNIPSVGCGGTPARSTGTEYGYYKLNDK